MTDTLVTEEGASLPPPRGVELPSPKYVDDGLWRDHASCRSQGSAMFFLELRRGESPNAIKERKEHAIGVCQLCPVTVQCLTYAILNEERWGIWGGVNLSKMTGAERSAVAKKVQELNP